MARVEDEYYALGLKCAHVGFTLDKGELFGERLICPLHLASYNVKTGTHEFGPVFKGLPTYKVSIKDNKVYVTVPKKLSVFKKEVEPVEK